MEEVRALSFGQDQCGQEEEGWQVLLSKWQECGMGFRKKKASRRVLVALLAIVAVVVPCGLRGLLGTRRTEIDVNSGRVRTRIIMFGVVVAESETETRFSQAIARNNLRAGAVDYRLITSTTAGPQRLFGTSWEYSKFGDVPGITRAILALFDLQPALRESERDIIARLTNWLQAGEVDEMREFAENLINREGGAARTEPTE